MNLDPQAMQAILQAGSNDPQAAALKQQQARIDMMRKQALGMIGGQNRGRSTGLASALAGGYIGRQAMGQQTGVDEGMQASAARTADARTKYMDAMMMAMRRQYPEQGMQPPAQPGMPAQPAPPMLPPDGMEDQ
jgi:hypothetical protein